MIFISGVWVTIVSRFGAFLHFLQVHSLKRGYIVRPGSRARRCQLPEDGVACLRLSKLAEQEGEGN